MENLSNNINVTVLRRDKKKFKKTDYFLRSLIMNDSHDWYLLLSTIFSSGGLRVGVLDFFRIKSVILSMVSDANKVATLDEIHLDFWKSNASPAKP